MKLAGLILILAIPGFAKDWKVGQVRVLDTDHWCGEQTATNFPGICGKKGEHTPIQFQDGGNSGAPQLPNPTTQILEIKGSDAVYIVKRESLDGGVRFKPGAEAQYAVDGKHLLIRIQTGRKANKLEILETRKP